MADPIPAQTIPPKPACMLDKVLVVNGDMHGRGFQTIYGETIQPGGMAWLNADHFNWLNQRNRMIKLVDTDN